MAGTFYLTCLGVPELRAPDGRVVKFRVRKHLALLVYLAVDRRSQHSRDELAHLLWSGTPMREARHSLATAISTLRRVLGQDLAQGGRDVVRFRLDDLLLDLDRMETGDLFATEALPAVEVQGFLAQFEVRDAQEFMLWRDRQQARWLPPIHQALIRLIEHHRRAGASRAVGGLADRLLAIDPLAEAGVRAKMEALAFAGDRIAALRVFEEYRELLQAELRAVPPPLLEGMARRLRRRGVERPAADPLPSVPTDPWRDRAFVGREEEYRQLYEAWEATAGHGPRHALVEGESGIGKSTLVERFAMAAALEGAVVARAQCYELEQALPFATIATLVKALHDKPGVAATDPARLAEVARVVPAIRGRFPALPEAMEAQGESARLHFAEGVLAMLEAAMEEQPVVLVIDDFQLADEVSLTVLHLLMRRIEAGRFMVLLTMRTSEVLRSVGARRIQDGTGYLRMVRLPLPPLTEEECTTLIEALTHPGVEPPTAAERQLMLQAARGVPMVIQLLMQDWGRHGSVGLSIVSRSMTERVEGTATQESSYAHILERVLGDLDPVTLLVLHTATVLGSRLNDIAMYQVAELSTAQVMMGLSGLAARHVLRDSPAGLDFVNDLVRAQAYVGMPLPLRRALHGAVADRLLGRGQDGAQGTAGGLEVAWHLVRAGRAAEAAPHLLRGGREAIQEGAPHEAELALKSALTETGLLTGSQPADARLLLAEVRQELSAWKSSLDALAGIVPPLLHRQKEQATLLSLVASRHLDHRVGDQLGVLIDDLLTLARGASQTSVRARALSTLAGTLDQTQSMELAPQLWSLVEELTPQCSTAEEHADVLTTRAILNYHDRETSRSLEALDRALSVLEQAKVSSTALVNLVIGLSAVACSEGRYDDALRHAERGYRLATRLDHDRWTLRAAGNAALACGRLGDYGGQLQWAQKRIKHIGRNAFDQEKLQTGMMIGMAKAMLGHRDAIAAYHSCVADVGPHAMAWVKQTILLIEADLYQLTDEQSKALNSGRRGTTGENARLHSLSFAGAYARWVSLVALRDGRQEEASVLLDQMMMRLDRYDRLDRAEIILSYLLLDTATIETRERLATAARKHLADLPLPVSGQLDRLGLLAKLR